jgi:hypothetical protein
MPHEYAVQFRYEHRKLGKEGRTIRVQGSSIQVAIAKATRDFVHSLDRRERFDCQKGLTITATRVRPLQMAPPEVRAALDNLIDSLDAR